MYYKIMRIDKGTFYRFDCKKYLLKDTPTHYLLEDRINHKTISIKKQGWMDYEVIDEKHNN